MKKPGGLSGGEVTLAIGAMMLIYGLASCVVEIILSGKKIEAAKCGVETDSAKPAEEKQQAQTII